jgi:hypothetical protein
MTSLREASPEIAAASQVLAGARAKGVRAGVPLQALSSIALDPQRPVPLQAGAFSFAPPPARRLPRCRYHRVVNPRSGHPGRPIIVP